MNFGQLNEDEFSALTETILELSDVGVALKNQNEDWFHGGKDGLSGYYGTLCTRLATLQKRLGGKCGVEGY